MAAQSWCRRGVAGRRPNEGHRLNARRGAAAADDARGEARTAAAARWSGRGPLSSRTSRSRPQGTARLDPERPRRQARQRIAACGGRRVAAEDPDHLRLRRHSRLPHASSRFHSARRRAGIRRQPSVRPPSPPPRRRRSGLHWTFAPMVDIARDARWGRIAEGAGEDPYLGSCVRARAGSRLPGERRISRPIASSPAPSTGSRTVPPRRVATTTPPTSRSGRSGRSTFLRSRPLSTQASARS